MAAVYHIIFLVLLGVGIQADLEGADTVYLQVDQSVDSPTTEGQSARLLATTPQPEVEEEEIDPRRIMFRRCSSYEQVPLAVFMTCLNKEGPACHLRKGLTHTLRVIFIPRINSVDVDSYVRWKAFIDIGLPNQIRDACGDSISCPVKARRGSVFTYHLPIEEFWPVGEYPVAWTLTDRETDEPLVCWRFKIYIGE